jgi:undecaprenyl phosphate-alpha-L-ara4FN deformylase
MLREKIGRRVPALDRRFALRVDIDTVRGLLDGVPPMLKISEELGVKATYFASVGIDTSARAFFGTPNLRRHLSVNPLRKYGLREILASLRGRKFAKHAQALRSIEEEGHEVGLHGYDHVQWIREALQWSSPRAAEVLAQGVEAFRAIFGRDPKAFASPGFVVNDAVLEAEEAAGFEYASDYHRDGDCLPYTPTGRRVLQIPVNAPLIEDLVAKGDSDGQIISGMLEMLQKNSLTVIYLHASYEPRLKPEVLSSIIGGAQEIAENVTLEEVKQAWNP